MENCEKNCENCRNQWNGSVCDQTEIDPSERIPCGKFKEYPKGITPKELIELLETMPQDKEIVVDTEGLFAVTGLYMEHERIYIDTELISW